MIKKFKLLKSLEYSIAHLDYMLEMQNNCPWIVEQIKPTISLIKKYSQQLWNSFSIIEKIIFYQIEEII